MTVFNTCQSTTKLIISHEKKEKKIKQCSYSPEGMFPNLNLQYAIHDNRLVAERYKSSIKEIFAHLVQVNTNLIHTNNDKMQ